MSKIYQITNLQILPSIVNFPNWISDTFCVKPWRKLLPSPAWMPNCRPVLPETDRLKAEPGLMIALFYPPDRTQIRDISSPVPLQWSPHPSRSALKPSFIKLGGFTRTEDASGSETRPRVGHQKFQHFSFTFKIGCADGFLHQQRFVLKHLLAPRKQSVNLLKQLVEDGPSSISDCERAKREKSHGEKCASAAATWCVCAKAKTIPVRDDLMVSSGCERLTKGKKKQCASPPPPAPPPAL